MTYYFEYRTKDGRKQRYRIGLHPHNKKTASKAGDTVTITAARKAALDFSADVIKGGDPHNEKKQVRLQRERAKHESLGGFIEQKYADWALAHQKRGRETLTLLESNFADLYTKRLDQITAWDMQKWRADKNKAGLQAASVNRRVTTLKAVLNKAVEWDVISVNPLNKIKPLKIDSKARIRYLSKEEENALRKALDNRETDIRAGRDSGNTWRRKRGYQELVAIDGTFADYLKPMVLLTLNTGMRRGEVFNLKWPDVDLMKQLLTVEGLTAKSGMTRHINLNSEVQQVLKDWRRQSSGDFVFLNPHTGKQFDNIKSSWTNLRKKAGIEDFRFHDLRHSFASKLVMAGVDLYTVKELMGHSTIQMTERYAHLAPEHKAKAVELLIS